jgi:hypothetical protein
MSEEQAQSRRQYQREYYLQRKEELSRDRKEKYRTDPEYREKAKEAARQYRESRRRQVAHLREIGKLPPVTRERGPRKAVQVEVDGEAVPAYTITTLASRLNRSVAVVNYWIRSGLLPKTPFRSARRDRLYTDGMILVVKMAVNKRGVVKGKDKSFTEEIVNGWAEIGIIAAKES